MFIICYGTWSGNILSLTPNVGKGSRLISYSTHLMLTAPAAMLARILGTKNGDSRLSFPSTCIMWTSSSPHEYNTYLCHKKRDSVSIIPTTSIHNKCHASSFLTHAYITPPTTRAPASATSAVELIPFPKVTPVACLSRSDCGSHLASERASEAEQRAYCMKVELRRGSCHHAHAQGVDNEHHFSFLLKMNVESHEMHDLIDFISWYPGKWMVTNLRTNLSNLTQVTSSELLDQSNNKINL